MDTLERIEVVKCFACNDELSTTWAELRAGRRSTCPSCGRDLQPQHNDASCGFCGGQGAARVNGAIWICSAADDDGEGSTS